VKRARRIFRWTLIAIPLVAIALAVAAYLSLSERYRGFDGETFVKIEHGSGGRAIGAALATAGVIRYPWQLWLVRAMSPSTRLQAGEYRFSEPGTVRDVVARISRGDVYYFEFTIPEGSNIFDIAQALEAARVMPAADFLRVAEDPTPIRDLAPQAKTLEGFLFPSTYRLTHSVTATELCRQMTDQFRKHWKKLTAARERGPESVPEVVTLASLVEKETALPSERALIAGVFTNRLAKNIRLGCDPTTIYAALLENRYRGTIHRSDLASSNPYNTYQHAGLPPGPIANPGEASLKAALAPAETPYLYFVAKPGGGGHHFSVTLAEHEKAVAEYRRGNKSSTPITTKGKGKAG
jgi:UPF0755 protein